MATPPAKPRPPAAKATASAKASPPARATAPAKYTAAAKNTATAKNTAAAKQPAKAATTPSAKTAKATAPVTAKATVPKSTVEQALREKTGELPTVSPAPHTPPPDRPVRPKHRSAPWLRPAPTLSDRIRRDPAPYVVAAVASAVAVVTLLKGRRPGRSE